MEISINQRLKKLVENKKINPPVFYKKIGVTRGTWSGWVNSNKAISVEKLVSIIKELNDINARWLLTGEGSMTNDEELVQTNEPAGKYGNNNCKLCEEKDARIKLLEEMLEMYRGKKGNDIANSA
jgi:predicted methyltransferase